METYTKLSADKLKISSTTTVDGFEITNERIEAREEIELGKTQTEAALAEHDARRQVFVDRLTMLNEKLDILGPAEVVEAEAEPEVAPE